MKRFFLTAILLGLATCVCFAQRGPATTSHRPVGPDAFQADSMQMPSPTARTAHGPTNGQTLHQENDPYGGTASRMQPFAFQPNAMNMPSPTAARTVRMPMGAGASGARRH